MDQNRISKANAVVGLIVLIILIVIYISPLILNLNKYFTFYPKNIPSWYANYMSVLTADSIFKAHQLPLWVPALDGGRPYNEYPMYEPFGPVHLLTAFLNENAAIKIYWSVFFLFGACSMYYLTYGVLGYTLLGALYSALIFTMSGAIANLFENGFYFCRELLLLPLLLVFFIKGQENSKFLVLSAFLLSLVLNHSALFFPVTVLFIFLFSVFGLSGKNNRMLFLSFKQLKNFIYLCGLTLGLSAFKVVPLLRQLSLNNRISGVNYFESISQANTFELFYKRIFLPESLGAGTMYIGFLPVIASILGMALYYKEVRNFIIILFLFILFSFGPNSPVDLHRILWNLPVFKSISEISKYYGIFIVFVIAILAGKAFAYFKDRRRNALLSFIFVVVIGFSYLDLLKSNSGYFNIFNEKIEFKAQKNALYHVRGLNLHQGDESITTPLLYFLYKKNVSLLGVKTNFSRGTNVVPKYFLLPKYAFMMPYTGLLVLSNPEYKSEAYFLNPLNCAQILNISPNKIDLEIKMEEGNDRLVINQNFGLGWKTNLGVIEDYKGLLSLMLTAKKDGMVRLRYFPFNFYIGLAISLGAFGLSCYLLSRKKRIKNNL